MTDLKTKATKNGESLSVWIVLHPFVFLFRPLLPLRSSFLSLLSALSERRMRGEEFAYCKTKKKPKSMSKVKQ